MEQSTTQSGGTQSPTIRWQVPMAVAERSRRLSRAMIFRLAIITPVAGLITIFAIQWLVQIQVPNLTIPWNAIWMGLGLACGCFGLPAIISLFYDPKKITPSSYGMDEKGVQGVRQGEITAPIPWSKINAFEIIPDDELAGVHHIVLYHRSRVTNLALPNDASESTEVIRILESKVPHIEQFPDLKAAMSGSAEPSAIAKGLMLVIASLWGYILLKWAKNLNVSSELKKAIMYFGMLPIPNLIWVYPFYPRGIQRNGALVWAMGMGMAGVLIGMLLAVFI